LGNGTTSASTYSSPVTVGLARTAVQLACGMFYACAVLSDGTVQCWGNNYYAQLGNGTSGGSTGTPQTVQVAGGAALSDVTSIAIGPSSAHVCALQGGTAIYCWGYAGVGQVGPNYDAAIYPYQAYAVPVSLANGEVAKALGLGGYTSCAVTADGKAQC